MRTSFGIRLLRCFASLGSLDFLYFITEKFELLNSMVFRNPQYVSKIFRIWSGYHKKDKIEYNGISLC